jgi:hypothetical protein
VEDCFLRALRSQPLTLEKDSIEEYESGEPPEAISEEHGCYDYNRVLDAVQMPPVRRTFGCSSSNR